MKRKWLALRLRLQAFLGRCLPGRGWVHSVGGSLPAPLKQSEEQTLTERMRAGDRTAGDRLVEHNLRLVVYIAKKFESSGVPLEDLVSIGTIGLIKAVGSFSPERGIKLATYASRCIENEILMVLRKTGPRRGDVSLDEPLNVDFDGNELLLGDVLGSDGDEVNDGLEREDEHRVLHRCIATLEERERQILCLRFGIGGYREHTQKEVADLLGISQSYISRLEKRLLQRLKREIEHAQ